MPEIGEDVKLMQKLAKIALLSVISFLLYRIAIPLPIFPFFLTLDLSNVPAVIGAVTMGPMAGVLIELVKNLLGFFTGSTTGGVGELGNFMMGAALVVPIGLIFNKRKSMSGYCIGCAVGILAMVAVACLTNYYILLPLYSRIMPLDAILEAASLVNPFSDVVDVQAYLLFVVVPFNIIKGVMVSVLGYLLYRSLRPILSAS
jgi:riboflavin transporter FmnP